MQPAPEFLVVALSGRALAAAAVRAGRRVAVVDLFADIDTRRLAARVQRAAGDPACGFDAEALVRAAAQFPGLRLVPGAGFEHDPALLRRIARGRRLLGTPPAAIARIKDPIAFARLLGRLGVPHPETQLGRPDDPRGWIARRAGAAGGTHVRPAARVEPGPAIYYHRLVAGSAVAAAFVADGRRARVIDLSAQWTAPTRRTPYRYGGAVAPVPMSRAATARLVDAAETAAGASGAVGLGSADFLVDAAGDFVLLEINPRPGATLDLLDRGGPPPSRTAFALHLAACDGRLPASRAVAREPAVAAAIVYADRAAAVPAAMRWPAETADRSPPGTKFCRGDPVCTVVARAATSARARAISDRKALAVLARLDYA
ncbi:MAG: ATP-grasp domain-containing protein [Alphaproteobacteria bacterium]|nr:ATP-grasp domain-containing protein [Alphaproteobacteria bacterium]